MHESARIPLRFHRFPAVWRRALAWFLTFLTFLALVPASTAVTWNGWQALDKGTDFAVAQPGTFTYQNNEHLFRFRARNRYLERVFITIEITLEHSGPSPTTIEYFELKPGQTDESSGHYSIARRVVSFRLIKIVFPDRKTNNGGGTGGGSGGGSSGSGGGSGGTGGGTGGGSGGNTDNGRIEFTGNTSWSTSGSKLTISVDQLWNHKNPPSNGPLRLYVMAGPNPYSGGSLDGFRVLGTYTFSDSLPAGYYYQNVNQTVAYTAPPNGTFYTIIAVAELVGSTHTVQDFRSTGQKTFGPVILPTPPSIQTQPKGATVNPGASVTFAVKAAGTAPLTYQWNRDGLPLSGANAEVLSLPNIATAQAGTYTVTIKNSAGSVTSQPAVLVVNRPPSITSQPQGGTVPLGGSITLSVAASGLAPLSYQWRFNNAPLAGKTATSLPFKGITQAQAGDYAVVVSNPAGSVTSPVARVTVNVPFASLRSTLSGVSWVKGFGGTGDDFVYAVGTDRASAAFLTGYFSGNASFGAASFTSQGLQDAFLAILPDGAGDLFLARLKTNGTISSVQMTGGVSLELPYAAALTTQGGLLIGGALTGVSRFGTRSIESAGATDGFLLRLDGLKAGLFGTAKPPRLMAVRKANGRARLQHDGEPGLGYDLETSIDLENWTPLPAGSEDERPIRTDEPAPSTPSARFFRAVLRTDAPDSNLR